jgi:MATE family multidrug resistance protein
LAHAAPAEQGVTARLLRLALPIIAVNLGMSLMGAVDTLMVGRVSAEALAAVAIGNVAFFAVAMLGVGIILALDPVISQALGADDARGIALGVQRGVLLAVLLGVPLGSLLLLAEPAADLLGQPDAILPGVGVYTRILAPSVLPFLLFTVGRQTLQALHRVGPVVWVIVLANLLNLVLNRWLIFGGWGLAPLGVAGSAWATLLSRLAMVLALLVLARRELGPTLVPWQRDAARPAALWSLLRIGIPIALHIEVEFITFGAVAMLMGSFGTMQVASHQIALNLASLTFMVPMGVGMGAAVMVGRAVGQGDPVAARAAARAALYLAIAFMSGTALLFLTVPTFLARLYSTDAMVVAFTASLLPIAGVFQVFDGVQVVAAGILRGLGDTRVPMLIGLMGFVVVGLGASLLLAYRSPLGAPGLWWGLVIGLATVALVLLWRVRVAMRRPLVRVER